MVHSTKTQTNSKLIWKQGDGWIIFNPPRSHPLYDEWQKLKQKEKEDNEQRD